APTDRLLKWNRCFQVCGTIQIDDSGQSQWVLRVQITCLWKLRPCCQPHGEVPSCGMTDRDYICQIEIVIASKSSDEVRSVPHVFKSPRPAAAAVAETSVFDIPRGNASIRQCGRNRPHIFHRHRSLIQVAKLCNPAATMNDDREWVRSSF